MKGEFLKDFLPATGGFMYVMNDKLNFVKKIIIL